MAINDPTQTYLFGKDRTDSHHPFRIVEPSPGGGFLYWAYDSKSFWKEFCICRGCFEHCKLRPPEIPVGTSFICRFCTGTAILEGSEFDRCSFDNAGQNPSLSWSGMMEQETTPSGKPKRYIAPGRAVVHFSTRRNIIVPNADDGCSSAPKKRQRALYIDLNQMPSARLLKAQLAGELWALHSDHETIRALPDDQREAYVSYYWKGMRAKEIADQMQVSVRTVEWRIAAARKKISKKVS
ncbi:MAG TPA: sigma factor-like helix-turn-helix DNA-binding protein [Terriglobia bacterium]|nr:sigma factor-like helix-turn-helix DNA-binding protein [Terriglobia bacterium]